MYQLICCFITLCFSTLIFAENLNIKSENKILESDVVLLISSDVNLPNKILVPAHQNVEKILPYSLPLQIKLSVKRTDDRNLPPSCNEKTYEYITLAGTLISFNVISSTESCLYIVTRKDKNGLEMQTFL